MSLPHIPKDSIAIIGSACRLPGRTTNVSKLWDLLSQPRDVLSRIPTSRFDPAAFYHEDRQHSGTSNVDHAYLLSEDIREFDAAFFNVKPVEAEAMDGQHRLLLETVYEALESAGLQMEKLRGSDTAVYVGQMLNDYNDHLIRDLQDLPTYFATGTSRALTANHISYFFDWHGPSMCIDTACSSSLVALHQAVQSLQLGDCGVAIASGVNLILGPEYFVAASKLGILSQDARCRMWDVDANGYARGEGTAVIVLKRLSDAISDGDHIESIIRATAVNQDGRTMGITKPSAAAQEALIRRTYAKAGLDLARREDLPHYFEAYGTGTQVGDPIEAEAIQKAFFGDDEDTIVAPLESLYVGSIKTVIGHTEGTAGLAAVLKASLCVQRGMILPNMHFNRLNPAIEPFFNGVCIPTTLQPWPKLSDGHPRRASVNSFGFGGTNAHAIIESYQYSTVSPFSASPEEPSSLNLSSLTSQCSFLPFLFSATTRKSLVAMLCAYMEYLKQHPSTNLTALAYTLSLRRSRFPFKTSFSARSIAGLIAQIDTALSDSTSIGHRPSQHSPSILAIFTGQGAQWPIMGKRLVQSSKVARECLKSLQAALMSLPVADRPSWCLYEELIAPAESSKLNNALYAQPICTAVQIMILDLLKSLGVIISAAVGHSSGEIAAAYAAGIISATDAMKIAYYRGFYARLAGGSQGQKGCMLAVGCSFSEATAFLSAHDTLRDKVCIAASNSSVSVTLSGDLDAIEEAEALLQEKGIFARRLKVDTAYHSSHMLRCAEPYVESLRACQIQVRSPSKDQCVWYSSVIDQEINHSVHGLNDVYWEKNMVEPVLFSHALETALTCRGPFCIAVEIGPHPSLKAPAQQTIHDVTGDVLPYTGTLVRGKDDRDAFAEALGCLWMYGGEGAVNFQTAYHDFDDTVSQFAFSPLKGLPNYPWDRDQKFRSDSPVTRSFKLFGGPQNGVFDTQLVDEWSLMETLNEADKPSIVEDSITEKLVLSTSRQETSLIVREAFSTKLEKMLRIASTPELLVTPADELGIDSLNATELRHFISKFFEVDLPVLMILNGATVGELVQFIIDGLPKSLAPFADNTRCSLITPDSSRSSDLSSSDNNTSISPYSDGSDPGGHTTSQRIASRARFTRTEKMSFGQNRFWFLRTYLEDPTTSNVTASYRLAGEFSADRFRKAVRMVAQRHEALRTCFYNDAQSGQPMQGILPVSPLHQEYKTLTDENEVAVESEMMLNHIFNFEGGETMRIALLSLSPRLHHLIIAYHHINMDGISLQIVLSDLEKAYRQPDLLSKTILQFPDFSIRQSQYLDDAQSTREIDFWRKQYPDLPQVLPLLPFSQVKSRQILSKYQLNKVSFRLTSKLAAKIKSTARGIRATSFHYYLAVFRLLLHRFLGIDDLCIGIADANRNDLDTLETIGMFLNLLPLRFKFDESQTFSEALFNAKNSVYAALEHSRLPFDILLDQLQVPRSPNHSPLFQAFVDYRQGAQESMKFGDCVLDGLQLESGRTAYDISLDITESTSGQPLIVLKTQSYLYSERDTQTLMNMYINLLEKYTAEPGCCVQEPPLYKDEDIQRAILIGRGPYLQSDWPSTLSHRIDQIMQHCPQRMAVKDGHGNIFNYVELQRKVSVIETALLDAGLADRSRVAVFQEPSADWICSLLAILRIGATYVPLCLRNPFERLAVIMGVVQPDAILTHSATLADVPKLNCKSTFVADVSSIQDTYRRNSTPLSNKAQPDSAAAILFTSGTTGIPKGIVLRHAGLKNEIEGYTKTHGICSEIVLQQSAFSFDFSLDQIFSALATGSTLYVVPKEKRGDPVEIAGIITSENITYTKATPSEYTSWIRYGRGSLAGTTRWTRAFAGGEPLTHRHLQDFRSLKLAHLHLYNSYGPGEISISSHKLRIPYDDEACTSSQVIPVGKCLPNYSVIIVDKNSQPVPIAVSGEVLIGGAGPALGYLDNEELTNEKFIINKHAPPEYVRKGWLTAYRSGDQGRLREDGALLFDGRIDGDCQIKLRGLRIELRDIEEGIISSSDGFVSEAAVSVRGEPEFLVAHVVVTDKHRPSVEIGLFLKQLRARLPLPNYMCPAFIIPLEQLPLTPHLKLDRRAISLLPLSKPTDVEAGKGRDNEDDHSLTETQIQLRQIWRNVISREAAEACTIDKDTDFFHIGGTSMLLPKLQMQIRASLETVMSLPMFFQFSTLESMASKIEETASTTSINWGSESSVSDIKNQLTELNEIHDDTAREASIDSQKRGKSILLTGATGFLGRAILKHIVGMDEITQIHCIAVRSQNGVASNRISVKHEKIVVHEANLSDPLLGLTQDEFSSLSQDVDLIIHSAAMRAFFEYYQLLRQVNVVSTKILVQLAASRKIPIHFVSSGGLLSSATEKEPQLLSVAHLTPPTDGSDGYLSTKWASEVILENAAKELGIPVYIHRALATPSNAEGSIELESILQTLLNMTLEMRTLPLLSGWAGYLDLVPTSDIVHGICEQMNKETMPGNPSMSDIPKLSFEHYPGIVRLFVKDILDFLEERVDVESYQQLNILKWLGRIKNMGFGYVISAQYLVLEASCEEDNLVSKR